MKLMMKTLTVALCFAGGIKEVSASLYSPVRSSDPFQLYTGVCADSSLKTYPAHAVVLKDWEILDNHFTLCKEYCNQHLLPGYVGLSYYELNNKLNCWCQFDSANGLPNVTYNPPSTKIEGVLGTGPVQYAKPDGFFKSELCWKFEFAPTFFPTYVPTVSNNPTNYPTTLSPTVSFNPTQYPTTRSPAALTYSLVGDGLCLDGSNQEFSRITFLGNFNPAECSATCIDNFNHPHLVGFELSLTSSPCQCIYSGGAMPSLPPPKNLSYSQTNNIGTGAVMTSSNSGAFDCFAYAQGTAPPTTPMATNAPISPSPTGTITSAPTPEGITSYTKIGEGACVDAKGDRYSYLDSGKGVTGDKTVDGCSKYCSKFPSPELVGFHFVDALGSFFCSCHYSGQNLATPPAGLDLIIDSTNTGAGPIAGTEAASFTTCYAFSQGTGSPMAPSSSPSKAPVTSSPTGSPMAPATSSPSAAPATSSPSAPPVTASPTTQSKSSKSAKSTKSTKSTKNTKVV